MEKLLEITEIELHHLATSLKLIIEGIAILIVAFSILKTVPKLIRIYKKKNSEEFYHEIRLDFGLSLALALEFLLAADIVATAVTPTWEAIGALGAITGVRTFLNYFLRQEVKELEAAKQRNKVESISEKQRNKVESISEIRLGKI
ncbi:MAG: DUF1622 domain-containing protein [Xenococcaceae cyanobacterium MO_167.B52]|nr:DUF1622 domain-containing protein [Xenococcaceae cyanobacterium MO_167.B52]